MITLTSALPLAAAPGSSPSLPLSFLYKHRSQVPDSAVLATVGRNGTGSSGQRSGSLQMLPQGKPAAGSGYAQTRDCANESHNLHSEGGGEIVGWAGGTGVDSSLSRASPQCPLLDASHTREWPWKPSGGLDILS